LFLAIGSSSFISPIEGNELKGVVALSGLSDSEKNKKFYGLQCTKKIVFVGAGFISMEIASLLVA
jgi:NADH dehydrogenase/NADH oxidase (H2O2-forming)